jgi:hypothetical protein
VSQGSHVGIGRRVPRVAKEVADGEVFFHFFYKYVVSSCRNRRKQTFEDNLK